MRTGGCQLPQPRQNRVMTCAEVKAGRERTQQMTQAMTHPTPQGIARGTPGPTTGLLPAQHGPDLDREQP